MAIDERSQTSCPQLLVDDRQDDAIFTLDPQGRVQSWSAAAQRLLGYSTREVIGARCERFYTAEDIAGDVPARELRQALATGQAAQAHWYVRKDGSRCWCGGITTLLARGDGSPHGFVKCLCSSAAAAQPADLRGDAIAYAEGIVETVREPLLILDGQLRVRSANGAFYRTFHVSPQDTEGRRLYDLGNGQWDIARLHALLEEILPQHATFDDFDVEHDFPGIGRKIMLLNARKLRYADAALILLAIEDVTERRRAETQRQALETRFTALVKNVKDHSIFTLDPEGRITSWNIAAEHVLGFTEAEVLGQHFAIIFTPDDRRRGLPQAELRMARAQGRAEDERWHLRKGGERFWALGIVSALYDVDGRLTGFSKILRDMTERKRAEQALRDSAAKYRSLFESIDEGFCIIALIFDDDAQPVDYRFLEVNPAFERQTGLVDVPGKTLREVLPASEAYWIETYARVALTGEPTRFVNYGAPLGRWFDVYAWRHGEPQDRQVAILFNDITSRKRAEEALREREEQLRALASRLSETEQRERKRLAAILHDHIQQLMVAARMQVGALRRNISSPERASTIAQGVEDILNEALEASRSLVVELSPPVLAEAGLLEALKWLAARMQKQHALSVRLHTQMAVEPVAEDVRLLIFECVRELLLNTVKHAGVTAVDVSLRRSSETEITVVVRDAGKGFDPDLLSQRRVDERGFGLFSIQERLAHLGGYMAMESTPGRGTRVTLCVPVAKAESPADGPATGAATTPAKTLRITHRPQACRVLIVDDHPLMREGLARLFEGERDIEVIGQASDGPEAIAAAAALAPDVVLMDVNLGDMDGIEATRRILARQPEVKVIGLSMHIDAAVAAAMRAAGAVAYLHKGEHAESLIAAIRACRAGPASAE